MTLTRLENGRQEILGLLPWDPEKAPIDQSHRIAGAKARAAGAKGRPGGISSSGIVRLNRKLKRMATEKPKASKIAGRMKQVFDALPPLAKVGGPVGSSAAGLVLLSKRTKMTRSYVSNCLTSLIKFGMVKRVDRGLYARTRG